MLASKEPEPKGLTPKDFLGLPTNESIERTFEIEVVARNIMVILHRLGNEIRYLTWEEYKEQRLVDGSFKEKEESYFDLANAYFGSVAQVKSFCPEWGAVNG